MNFKVSQLKSLTAGEVAVDDLIYVIDSNPTDGSVKSKKVTVGDLIDSRIYGISSSQFVLITGYYADPSWITSLDWSKITNAPSFVTSLSALTDVSLSSPVPNQLLRYNGTSWYNWTPTYYSLPAGGTTLQYIDGTGALQTLPTTLPTSTVKHLVKAGVPITKGQAVYVTSADGTNMIVGLASNASESTSSKTMGLLDATVSTNGFANVVTEGLLAGLDTTGANAAGDPVWLGTGGNLIYGLVNKPYAPNHLVFIGIVTRRNANNGEIFVKVQNGFELNEIHDVDVRNPDNNDGIFYNSTTQLWEHKQISSVFPTPTLDSVTTAGNTTTNEITVNNVVIGGGAGGSNTFIGQSITSRSTATLDANTFVGFAAGANFIGNSNGNTALGWLSLNGAANNAEYNTAIGGRALSLNTSQYNTALGYSAGYNNTSGSQNVYIGYNAGLGITTGSNNTIVGASITGLASNLANTLILGAANSIRIYSPSTGNILIGTTTDAGYRLDVNGTGRYSSTLTIQTAASDASPSNSILISTSSSGNGGRISWGDSNTSILRYSNSLYFREYTGNFVFESTGSGGVMFSVRPAGTTVSVGNFVTSASMTAASAIARGVYFNNTLVAAANNDVLVGLDINPTFTNGAFTGVQNYAVRIASTTSIVRIDSSVIGSFHGIEFSNSGNIDTEIKQRPSTGEFRISNGRFAGWGGFITLYTDTAERMRIGNNGNVLIGTTTDAGYKLDVNGSLRTTGILYSNNNLAVGNYDSIISPSGSVNLSVYSNVQGTPGRLVVGGYTASSSLNSIISFVNTQLNTFYPGQFEQAKIESYWVPNGSTGGDLRFYTRTYSYLNERLRITDSGNILINTTTDSGYRLDVNGTARIVTSLAIGNSSGDDTITLNPQSSGSAVTINNGGYIKFTSGITSYIRCISTAFQIVDNTYTSRISFSWAGASYINTGGNLVIGTSTDAGYKLDVNGTGIFRGNLEVNAGANGGLFINNLYPRILFGKTGTPTWSMFVDTENAGQFELGTGAGFPYNTFSSRLYITNSGNVGIGKTNPTYKLEVFGGIRSAFVTTTAVHGEGNTLLLLSGLNGTNPGVNEARLHIGYNQNDPELRLNSGGIAVSTGKWTFLPQIWFAGGITSSHNIALTIDGMSNGVTSSVASEIIRFTQRGGQFANFYDAGAGLSEFRIWQQANSSNYIYLKPGQTSYFSSGNLVIGGTTDAGYKLDVNGTVRFQDHLIFSSTKGIYASTALSTVLQSSTNYFTHNRIGSSGTLGFQISVVGNVQSFWRYNDGTGDVEFGNANGSYHLGLYAGNTERVKILGNGNVGIGTTSPTAKVHVVGSGSTSATSSLIVQNSGGSVTPLKTTDDGTAYIGWDSTGDFNGIFYANGNVGIGRYSKFIEGRNNASSEVKISSQTWNFTTSTFYSTSLSLTPAGVLNLGSYSGAASSILTMTSTTRGFLAPRMTTAQILAITTPAEGLQVYNTDLHTICFFDGTIWQRVTSTAM